MIWPTMKRTPQKLKRPRKEPQPGLKLCKRKRRNLAPSFPFPRLRRIALQDLVVRPVLFLLRVVIFVPKVDTPETFSEAPICVFEEREVTGPVLAHPKINSCRQDQNHDFSVLDQCKFDQSEQGVEDPSCIQRSFVQGAISELLTRSCIREAPVYPPFCNPLHVAVQSSGKTA